MVVLGGTALSGGCGGIGLTLIGASTMGYLQRILSLNAFQTDARLMLTGAILLLAAVPEEAGRRGQIADPAVFRRARVTTSLAMPITNRRAFAGRRCTCVVLATLPSCSNKSSSGTSSGPRKHAGHAGRSVRHRR